MNGNLSLYERLGGRPTLERVHKIFYDKIYAHPWIGQYFKEIDQQIIEIQQSDFMAQAMGGPAMYCGKLPVPAHRHMNISEELFDLRTRLLKESLHEANIPLELQEGWLKIDQAFRRGIVKKGLGDCSPRFASDEILDFPNPSKPAA